MRAAARYMLMALALLGAYAGVKLSLSHLSTGETCPMLGPVPACYIVALGYLAVLVSTIFKESFWSKPTFFLGWAPVAGLALFGVVFELAGHDICPPGALGIPQCFYSFLMAMSCLGLFLLYRRNAPTAKMAGET